MPRGRIPTAGVEEASVVVVLVVVAMSAVGAAGLDQLEAEAVSVAMQLASVEHASLVEAGISQVELAWHRSDRTSFRDPAGQQLVDRRFQTSHAIVTRFPHPHVHREWFRNAD